MSARVSAQAQMRAKLAKFKANKAFAKRPAKQVKAAKTQVAKALQKAAAKQRGSATYKPSFDALHGLDDLLKEGEALLQQKPRPTAQQQTPQANKMEFAFQSNKTKKAKKTRANNFSALPNSAAKTKASKRKGLTVKQIKTKIKSHNAKHCLKLSGSRATLLGRLGKATSGRR
jgi:hypothetical protein